MSSQLWILVVFALIASGLASKPSAIDKLKESLLKHKKRTAEPPKMEPLDTRSKRWVLMNHYRPVCFQGRGDKPGHVVNDGRGGLIGALKLVWRSGSIRCVANTAYDSRWGCYHYNTFIKYPLNVILTDNHKNIIFPRPQYITHKHGLWYSMPMVDDRYSNELVFASFGEPFYWPEHGELKVWYGEDLKNWAETDNQGKVCVDVYGRFM